ncbi:MAG: oligosaccharide flippase family protein [Candidatus Omnitrophica bacterium]|nr:oligosaccharide flippase family protein [Candidatus Omnitrophota bacterium]
MLKLRFTETIRADLVKGSIHIMASNSLTSLLSFVLFFLIARFCGPAELGIFSIFYSVLMIVSNFFDQGISLVTIHFYNRYREMREEILKVIFKIRLFIIFLICCFLFLSARFLASDIFGKPELAASFRNASFAIFFGTFIYFTLSVFRAKEMYREFALFKFIYLAFASIGGIIMISRGVKNTDLIMHLYSAGAIVSFAASFGRIGWGFIFARVRNRHLMREFVEFGKWIVLSAVCFSLSRNMLLFLVGKFASLEELGRFSLAYQIINGISVLFSSLTVVLFSHSSRIETLAGIKRFISKSAKFMVVIAIMTMAVLAAALSPAIKIIFGKQYEGVSKIALILFIGQGIFIISFPLKSAIVNYFKDVKGICFIDILLFILIIALCPFLLRHFGTAGGAAGYSASLFISYLIGRYILFKSLARRLN